MKCPICAGAELVHDTRDIHYTYKGESTVIPSVTGDFCPACGEAVLQKRESVRISALMLEFNKQVNASISDKIKVRYFPGSNHRTVLRLLLQQLQGGSPSGCRLLLDLG